ncbi:hypothetical protein BCR37DRAFT_377325 [Protomyces lactucae-debilis]|uniref:Kinetochore protein Spc24 n=1 Tax=Protomyces lactucae-debilis TaxID=2754530 RepID=A0A1Y2FNQ6_PROLT|nr:uncharacterized protein BCR37DRAFT_377325 [Protomyces lactucae-debilis]ORY85632.1 hypothetical protein BCR37DRAFT_377325 [Protomyces lactucae-debilis]
MPDYNHDVTGNKELISTTKQYFSIEDDVGAIQRVSQALLQSRQQRQQRRAASRTILQDLSRQLEQARGAYTGAERQREGDHGTVMNTLDREKFALAKEINSLEGSAHTLSSRLAMLTETLAGCCDDVAQEPHALAGEQGPALTLAVYRDLGIRLVEDGNGGYGQAVVCGKKGKEVHVLQLEKPAGFYADHLWSLAAEAE